MSEESKFNFSEEEQQRATNEMNKDKAVEQSKEAVRKDAKGLFQSMTHFFTELLDFRDDTDRDATIQAIKGDIPFKGATAWILVCSIFVASIGLNANSTAVVIGAMLISPLMGPILGVGMSIAINDIDTLRKSLINLATMIVLSLLTAFLFFWLFPLSEETSELLGRTRPDIRDVLIAFFGGLALIIARTKKGTIASVIFGVAIATALMPPLCTAGYGLAEGNFQYFGGAMYLFTINTIFIALATFLVLKILRFPMLKYANSKKRKRIAQLASLVAVLVMVPAVWTFLNVLTESKYQRDYKNFIKNEIEPNPNLWLQRENMDMDARTISLYFNGELAEATITDLENELKGYENIQSFDLRISGNKNRSSDKIIELYDKATIDLEQKDYIITGLREEIETLKSNVISLNDQLENRVKNTDNVLYSTVAKDAKIRFSDLEYFGYAKMLESSDFIKVDTVTVVSLKWNSKLNDSLVKLKENEIKTWLNDKLKEDRILILKED
ncbi:DUF389 domain-containing protein [Psychroserpens mesophilus]|uniref:DUF389 domain-containing protein n=1 Tax=Psychroserpens mesophilus TaxID=325473 RepID=UPI000694E398|nr:DUF389 domain-containing protein [Psychroserpens mesophilus]